MKTTEKKKLDNDDPANKIYQKSKPVSSHREFFQRLYGNLETSYDIPSRETETETTTRTDDRSTKDTSVVKPMGKVISASEKLNFQHLSSDHCEKPHNGRGNNCYPASLETEHTSNKVRKNDPETERSLTTSPYYNLQFCQQTLQVSMRPFYSAIQIDPLSVGFSAFCEYFF